MKKKIRPDLKGDMRKSKNRPDHADKRPRWALFSTQGSTGWRRRRDISSHKGYRVEDNFSDQHHRFTDQEEA
jgi:hypothetical protein